MLIGEAMCISVSGIPACNNWFREIPSTSNTFLISNDRKLHNSLPRRDFLKKSSDFDRKIPCAARRESTISVLFSIPFKKRFCACTDAPKQIKKLINS